MPHWGKCQFDERNKTMQRD